ncbi:TIGR00725 family protein [Isoptericola variabilis]|uniref:TIGR00725 family protein n=1 Tax=Isoptericola variabilis (strain 225) TaxID=743718 RepID=F6FPX0_ISOV2|nr:TIGR00725 family protein [Isoptericola variabilis]AEG43759.1 Conserved hypothetical protein CHP00725 [Isoptericola variabilis 225]TWH27439.1 hypothetical protein L600_000500001120 [Isoptericola variabilis J7]
MALQVAVCGPRECSETERSTAHDVGRLLAEAGAVVLTGGGGGVMAAASAGARAAGGLVVGVLPGGRDGANPHVSVALATGLGEARNAVLVASADVVVVVGGSWGTLSEVALARRRGTPVVTIGGWQVRDADGSELPDGPRAAATPEEAVAAALAAAGAR